MDIRITVRPDLNAMARGVRYVMRRRVRYLRIGGAVLIVLGLLAVLLSGGTPDFGWVLGFVLVLCGVLYELMPAWYARRAVRNRAKIMDEPRTYAFTEQGVAMSSASQSNTMVWSAFARIVDTGEDLLLMPARHQVIPVPRDAFTPGQFNELSVFLSGQGLLAGQQRRG